MTFSSAPSRGWEIVVKRERHRLRVPASLSEVVDEEGFTHLPATFQHAERAALLPKHDRDPFERFPIAKAEMEGLNLVARDSRIRQYEVRVLEA